MLLAAGGDVGIQPPLLTGLKLGRAPVTRISHEHTWSLAGVGFDSFEHGQ